MKIIVRSYNRAGNVLTLGLFPQATICIPASQEKDYRQYYDNLMVIPDGEDGNCAKKSNAILNRVDDDVMLLDDDITGICYLPTGRELTPEQAYRLVEQGFILCHDLNAGLWGLNGATDAMKIRDFIPFSLTKPVYTGVGIVKDAIRFDGDLMAMEDIDFWLRKLKKYRKIFRFNLYGFMYSNSKSGGIGKSNQERIKQETEVADQMQKRWGKSIIQIKARSENVLKLSFHSPIRGI